MAAVAVTAAVALTACSPPARPVSDRVEPIAALLAVVPVVTTSTTVPLIPRASRSRSALTPRIGASHPAQGPAGDLLDRLADCESGRNPRAIGGGGRFFGAWQFTLRTFASVGGVGNPIDYSYAEQKVYAARLLARDGLGQWPVCGRRAAA